MNRSWLYIVVASFFEVGWVAGLKHSDSLFTWSLTMIAMVVSFSLVILATRNVPVGTAYAVFVGLGTTGTVLMEMLFFGEEFVPMKIVLIMLLLVGVIGLKLVSGHTAAEKGNV